MDLRTRRNSSEKEKKKSTIVDIKYFALSRELKTVIIKTYQLMLLGELIFVISEIHNEKEE